MKGKKILVITIITILVLVVASTILGYLYVYTDMFKSDKELFAKYISQNAEVFQKIAETQTAEVYKNLTNEEKYESNTNVKMAYSEGGEVSNPINNLAVKLDVQKDNADGYFYADGQIIFGDEEYLESEVIKEKELYGIRFTDVAKQFTTVKNDQKLETIAKDIGTDSVTLEKIMNIIDGTTRINQEIMPEEERQTLKEKYLNLIIEAISNGAFESNKKAMITYNNNTITTNAYTVSLSKEQVEVLLVQILNNLKTENEKYEESIDRIIKIITEEKEMPQVKITVYEQNQNTIRTVVEIGLNKIVIENVETNEEIKSIIQFSKIDSEQANEYGIKLSRKNAENQEDISLIVDVENGEDKYTYSFLSEMLSTEESIKLNTSISYKKDIVDIALMLENDVDIGQSFEKKQTLTDNNNVILNNMEDGRRKNIIGQLKERVPLKTETRIELLKDVLGLTTSETDEPVSEFEMTQVEVNKFNAKFEFYTGNEVSAESVKTLLGIVKGNLGNCEITPVEKQESPEQIDPEKIKYNIKLNIEKNKVDEAGINQALEKIDDKKKYKVSISYKEQSQLIDYIIIEEVEK